MSKESINRPLIGKNSNAGNILWFLFILCFISLFVNPDLYLIFILCLVVIVFLDTLKIRSQNNGVGPSLLYGILTLFLWILIVPIYIYRRRKYANDESNLAKSVEISDLDIKSVSPKLKDDIDRAQFQIQIKKDEIFSNSPVGSKIYPDEKNFSKQSEIMWAGDNPQITILNHQIPNPMIYWISNSAGNNEASCISLDLPIGKPIDEPQGSLGYWPTYAKISPDQRANYLDWLSTGRNSELNDIGYAFLFFYGLEYRALIEKKDIPAIVQEVNLLLKKYPVGGSFDSYLSSFLAYIAVQQLDRLSENELSIFFPNRTDLSYDQVIANLSWYISHDKPIPWELAYSLANTIPETPKSVITHKLPKEFKQLFFTKYNYKYPNGFKIEPSKRKYKYEYRPASPSLLPYSQNYRRTSEIGPIEIPSPIGKKSQFNGIFSIWKESIDDLKPASRKIGSGEEKLTSQAYHLLPDSLKQELDHPEKSKWDEIIETFKGEDDSIIVPVHSLAELISIEKRERLTPTQSKSLFSAAHDVGYVVIPDYRITGKPYLLNESVALFPLLDKRKFTSDTYPAVAFLLELGIGIALADGVFSEGEREHLDRFIFGYFELTPLDIECLKQYQKILMQNPPSLDRLGSRLKQHLSDDKKVIVAEFLRDMVLADGVIDPMEYQSLNKLYKGMGLQKDDIDKLFPSDITSIPDNQPIQIISSSTSVRLGEPIIKPLQIEPAIKLDQNVIDDKLKSTKDIQRILGEVMDFEDTQPDYSEDFNIILKESENSENSIETESNDKILKSNEIGLDQKYLQLLYNLLQKTDIQKSELQIISRNFGLMVDGAIDDINTWSDENFGDYLLEEQDRDHIIINSEIKDKIWEELQ